MRRAAGRRTMDEVSGMATLTPVSSRIFVVGLFAVTALPPFGPFFSELGILRAALGTHHGLVAAGFLGALLLAFFGMTRLVFAIVDGRPRAASKPSREHFREAAGTLLPPLALLGCSLWLGLATPGPLMDAWTAAVSSLFGPP
jgi:hydrogenase-4 component F